METNLGGACRHGKGEWLNSGDRISEFEDEYDRETHMPFLIEAEPPRGIALACVPGISRVVARNPSVMTYFGTNTYLIEAEDGLTVLDPGPDDPVHVRDVIDAAAGRPVRRIALTHTHRDHFGATAALKNATGAPVYAFHRPAVPHFTPDHAMAEGDEVAGLKALHTPGHASDHFCFAYQTAQGPVLFSGDHVMSWSSSIVSPPDGNMKQYYENLLRLLERDDQLYLPGHGPMLSEPLALVRELVAHRLAREKAILTLVGETPASVAEIAGILYAKQDPWLKIAAERNVLAHLQKLQIEGRVFQDHEVWRPA